MKILAHKKQIAEIVETNTSTFLGYVGRLWQMWQFFVVDDWPPKSLSRNKTMSILFEKMRENDRFQGFIVIGWATNLI